MIPSPLEIERTFFTHWELQAAQAPQAVAPGGYESIVEMGHDPASPRRLAVTLTVRLLPAAEGATSYQGILRAVACFRVAESVPPEKMPRLVAVHGASLLYGMIREQLCNLTARGPWPMLVLPTANFSDLEVALPASPSSLGEHS